MTDPENVTELQPADLAEVEVDEVPDETRPRPLEADDADVDEQRAEVEFEDEPEQGDTY